MKRIGVDVGGTFTDLILVDEEPGRITGGQASARRRTTRRGRWSTASRALREGRVSLSEVDNLLHGTTVATNIVLTHTGAEVGMITTEGFRDILHIARHKKPYNFSLQQELPWQSRPLVKRRHRLTVEERITVPDGDVLAPLDEDEVRERVRELRDAGVEAIAVCLLHSYLNPAHEQRIKEIVLEEYPDATCRFPRGAAAVPGVRALLDHRAERLCRARRSRATSPGSTRRCARAGFEQEIAADAVLRRHGRPSRRPRTPVNLMMSGPVAGLIGGIWAGRAAGFENVVTLDIGGTSADIGVAAGGELRMRHLLDTKVGDYQAMVPMVDIDTIGAGGGSIAYVDEGEVFRVGPQSAGADPGPACYGRGGTEPTATDAQLLLGRLRPDRGLLGGDMNLDSRARRAGDAAARRQAGHVGRGGGARRAADPEVRNDPGDRAQLGPPRL